VAAKAKLTNDMESPKKLSRYWLVIALPVLAVLCSLIAIRIVNSMDYHQNDNDFFTFWLAGHLVSQGGSPYDTTQWVAGYHQFEIGIVPNLAFLYPLPLALLLAPLGLLPFHTAYIVWVTLIQLMILTSLAVLLSMDANPRAKLFFIPLLAGIVLFRPTILTLTQGQVSGLFLFALAWVTFLWQKEKWFWGGFLMGLLALKPNLGVPVILLLTVWFLLQKHWNALRGTVGSGILLLAAGLIYNPGWIAEYWKIGNDKLAQNFGGSPTVWGLAALTCPGHSTCALIPGSAVALLVVIGFFWLVLRSRAHLAPLTVVGLAVSVTLLVTPYTWTYDQLLLIIPITVVTLAMDRMGYGFPLTATIFLGIDFLVVVLLFFDVLMKVEILNAIVPIVVLGLCAWCQTRWIRKAARPSV
jgi:hypothetical protein